MTQEIKNINAEIANTIVTLQTKVVQNMDISRPEEVTDESQLTPKMEISKCIFVNIIIG